MKKNGILTTAIIVILLLSTPVFSQISSGGTPKSFQRAYKSAVAIPSVRTANVDVARLLAEDEADSKLGIPYRFGTPFYVSYTLDNSGIWETLPDGGKLWRLRVESEGAYSINLLYDFFEIPEGAQFFLYSEDRTHVLGAFTTKNNKPYQKFSTAPIKGPVCILEYYEPAHVEFPGIISITRIVHAYKNIFNWGVTKEAAGFGSSGPCNNNVNCPEGAPWQDEKRAVAMVILGNGTRWCSGAMINNVREDFTPYFLTANHCLGGENYWIIMFNYESPNCNNINGPTNMTVSGTTLRATNAYSDFALVELSELPPDSFEIYFAGWSNIDTPAPQTVGIHHPAGDIKKISFDYEPVTSTSYLGTSGVTHWRIGSWNDGTTEGGSSGSPLFDDNHRIIGQLHGGYASCESITSDWYGKFAKSWNYGSTASTRLSDWLDPDNTGAATFDGLDAAGVSFAADITLGWAPVTVNFTDNSSRNAVSWVWDFGDGDSAYVQNPTHIYDTPGLFDVKLEITDDSGYVFQRTKLDYVISLADTIIGVDYELMEETKIAVTVNAKNNVPLSSIQIPIEYSGDINLTYDSFSTAGLRTSYFTGNVSVHTYATNKLKTIMLRTSIDGSQPELQPGDGPIVNLYFTVATSPSAGQTTIIALDGYNSGLNQFLPLYDGSVHDFQPPTVNAVVTKATCCVLRGDVNIDGDIGIADITYIVEYFFLGGPAPLCKDQADVNNDGQELISDLTFLVDFMFNNGPSPDPCQ